MKSNRTLTIGKKILNFIWVVIVEVLRISFTLVTGVIKVFFTIIFVFLTSFGAGSRYDDDYYDY